MLLLQFCSVGIYGQGVSTLSQLFALADANSRQLLVSQIAIQNAVGAISVAQAARMPQIDVSFSLGYLANGVIMDRNFSNATSVKNPHFTNSFSLKAQQLVYAGGAVSGGIEMAKLGREMALLDMESNREEIRFVITGQYLDLCRMVNEKKVLDENLHLANSMIETMKARVAAGTILSNDVTRYELQRENIILAQQKLHDAIDIIMHGLCTTLHISDSEINPNDLKLEEIPLLEEERQWQMAAAMAHNGLKKSEVAMKMSEQRLKIAKSDLLPKVAIVAENHFDGPVTIEVPVIDKNFNYWFVGVGLQYSLSSIFKEKRNVVKAKVEMREAKEQRELAMEKMNDAVHAAYTNVLTAQAQLRVYEKSAQLAHENYTVTSNRYSNGLCLLTDLIDAGSTLLNADIALVNAQIEILYNYYKLKYTTSTL